MRWLLVSTGWFIRPYLLEHGEATITELYRALKKEKLKGGSYANLRNYIYWLERLGWLSLPATLTSNSPAATTG